MNRSRKQNEWLIRQITAGETSLQDSQIRRMAQQMNLKLGDCSYFCVAIRFVKDDPQAVFNAALATAKSLKNDVFGYISTHETVILMLSEEKDSRSAAVDKLYRDLSRRFAVRLGVGRSYHDLGKLSYSRAEALEAARDMSQSISYVDDIYVSRSFTTRKLESQRRRIVELFKNGKLEQMEESMALLAETVRSESPVREDAPYPTSIRRTILGVLFEIMHIGADAGVDVDKLMDYQDPYDRMIRVGNSTPILLNWLMDIVKKIYAAIAERNDRMESNMLLLAKKYIDENLSDPDLSLSSVSRILHITPTYFSAFFIREMGMGFQEYVADLRTQQAKSLLNDTNQKISDIAEVCGFRSASYFIVVFRKQTGMSPGEYRNRKKQNEY